MLLASLATDARDLDGFILEYRSDDPPELAEETTTRADTTNIWFLSDLREYDEAVDAAIEWGDEDEAIIFYAATSYWEETFIETPPVYTTIIDAESIVSIQGRRYYVYRHAQYEYDKGILTNVLLVSPVPPGVDTPPTMPEFVLSPEVRVLAEKGVIPLAPFPEEDLVYEEYAYIDHLIERHLAVSEDELLLSDVLGVNDPIEGFNRAMFVVDGALFTYFFSPVGKAYRFVVPLYVREGIQRMDENIMMPRRFVNCLLQAKFTGAGVEFTRFLVNTTVGLVGFYDPAYHWMGLQPYDEDTGQTFAVWGIGPGFYLYLPVIGPSTARDGVGLIFDEALDPRTYAPFGGYAKVLMKFNNMTLVLDDFEKLSTENLDPYTFMRDMWYLTRTAKIAN